MSSTGGNFENPLELIQKTYNIQTTTTNNLENSPQARSSVAKVSIHQPSRKTSVHDIHEVTRDDLNKILSDFQQNLSRLKVLLETLDSISNIREEFFKLKDYLFKKINDFIYKLANESGKRASVSSKGHSTNLVSHHPQHLVYCIEYFRSELIKSVYLFYSLTSFIDPPTLNNLTVKAIFDPIVDQIPSNGKDMQVYQDIKQIKKDICNLEEHIYVLNQRYYSQIPDGQGLDNTLMTTDGTFFNSNGLKHNRLTFNAFTRKLSTASSTGSNENLNVCNRFYQKCHLICCICAPNYI